MNEINVVVLSPIGEENLRRTAAVSPRVKVMDASKFWMAPAPHLTPSRIDPAGKKKFEALLSEAEVIFGFNLPPDIIANTPRLKWIQALFAGVDTMLTEEIVRSKVIVTRVSGLHTLQISELVLEMMLLFVKHASQCFKMKQEKQWQWFIPDLLHSKTLGIVGLGNVGKGIARLGKAFGMNVVATRRSAKKVTRARYVDTVYPKEQLLKLLGESDFVVLCLPATPETENMIGERELHTMKSTAYLINIGRGATVDEDDLIRALEQGWIAGAGLDVFAKEPLPPESKLWLLPNVIMTPHIAGNVEDYITKATEFFCENLKLYVSGKKLPNIVNKKRGY